MRNTQIHEMKAECRFAMEFPPSIDTVSEPTGIQRMIRTRQPVSAASSSFDTKASDGR